MSEAVFKTFVTRDSRDENTPKTRHENKRFLSVQQVDSPHLPVRAQVLAPEREIRSLATESSFKTLQVPAPCNDYRPPRNVFQQEKILEHPNFGGRGVSLEPEWPLLRGIPTERRSDFIQLGGIRREIDRRTDVPEISVPHLEASRFSFLTVKQGLPRLTEITEPASTNEKLNLETRRPTARPDSFVWRNISEWESVPGAYSPRFTTTVDYKLEKRKERQEAYKKRREAQKERCCVNTLQYINDKRRFALEAIQSVPFYNV